MIAIFAGHTYYPNGGWDDCVGIADNLEQATIIRDNWQDENRGMWWHFVDLERLEPIAAGQLEGDY